LRREKIGNLAVDNEGLLGALDAKAMLAGAVVVRGSQLWPNRIVNREK
jgi:hypothetical protein